MMSNGEANEVCLNLILRVLWPSLFGFLDKV